MTKGAYILVVDDNKDNLRLAGNILTESGYKIAVALNGESALKILNENSFDLVLLDIMMPEMDGIEVCRRIKLDGKLKDIPVIFLTAKNQPEDLLEGFNVGSVDYITKPFNKEEFLARVSTHVELARSKKKIVELNKNRDIIYSIIAHDIRAPFSRITQTIDAVVQGYIDPKSDVFMELFQMLSNQTSETFSLIDNLLEWTQTQGGMVEFSQKNVNIHELINKSINLLKANADTKKISLINNVDQEITAFCESKSIATVFRNLISNSIKFTPENGTIAISCSTNDISVFVTIVDSGIGMSDDMIEKIFVKNERHTGLGTNDEHGTGLGIQVIKDFVKRNNGEIAVESNEGNGTSITITLHKSE
jgi:two-component system sensor histidine kinase/response regulator